MPEDRAVPWPLPYHARTEHRLPLEANQMQTELDDPWRYTDSHLMAISKNKTKTMLCNTRIKWDFIPELNLDHDKFEVVQEMKIVGFIMRSDMRTCSNTEYLVKKAYKRMWLVPASQPASQYQPTYRRPAETSPICSVAGGSSLVLPDYTTGKKGYRSSC